MRLRLDPLLAISGAVDIRQDRVFAHGMDSYEDHFAIRGTAYDRAMMAFPDARKEEFLQAVREAPLGPGAVVADVPAGGGYLRRYLPDGCVWRPHEPCASFVAHHAGPDHAADVPLLPLPWRDASIDAALSIAGIHHIEDKRPLFAELFRVVKPGGALIVSDVAAGSNVAHFLDDYVGANNSTGHQGMYLDDRTIDELEQTGWNVEGCRTASYHWIFPDAAGMAAFCHALFDLRKSQVADTAAAIGRWLGFDELEDAIGLRWSLLTIRATRL